MGIYRCDNKRHVYDIETEEQGIVFLCLAFIFLLYEFVYLWKNIKLFRRQQQIQQTPTLVVFYVSMHILFIRTFLYSLGGVVICYGDTIYSILGTYFYILKRFVFFIIVYRIAATFRNLNEFTIDSNTFLEKAILFFGCADFIIYNLLYVLLINDCISILPSLYYDLTIDVLLMMLFIYFVYKLMKCMKKILKYIGADEEISKWKIFIIIMSMSFFMRVLQTVFYLIYDGSKKMSRYVKCVEFTIYLSIYALLTEIMPCMVMMWIISNSDNNKKSYVEKKESEASSINQEF